METEWIDNTTSWIPLKDVKNSNNDEISNYALRNNISTEPAFKWWVCDTPCRKKQLIKLSQCHHCQAGYKCGIRIPNSIEEALTLDKENNNTLWLDAIQNKMHGMMVALKFLKEVLLHPGTSIFPFA